MGGIKLAKSRRRETEFDKNYSQKRAKSNKKTTRASFHLQIELLTLAS